jgi:hypothetical protein
MPNVAASIALAVFRSASPTSAGINDGMPAQFAIFRKPYSPATTNNSQVGGGPASANQTGTAATARPSTRFTRVSTRRRSKRSSSSPIAKPPTITGAVETTTSAETSPGAASFERDPHERDPGHRVAHRGEGGARPQQRERAVAQQPEIGAHADHPWACQRCIAA